ncbi:mucin-1-like [Polyergus mexicanus]|uniref:mucin-1-like n=1 Tax=Polyergus mexicanus TaxID=615972 RepID=UPI0038B4A02A
MAQSPLEVVLTYPLAERVCCPRCWGSTDRNVRSRGDFCDTQHLSRHIRKFHPGDTIAYVCSICDYRGTGAVPYRRVKEHFEKEHVPRTEAACRTVRGAQRTLNNIGGVSGVRTRASASAPSASASAGASSRSLTSSRPPTSRSAATTSTRTSPPATTSSTGAHTPSGAAGESPSYAAVTAAGPATRRTSPSLATTSTRGAAILTSQAAMTAAILGAATRRTSAAATTGKAHPQDKGGSTGQDGAANRRCPSGQAAREARKSPRRPSSGGKSSTGSAAGAPPSTTSQAGPIYNRNLRRSTSAPLVKSGASRPARAPPRRSPAADSPSFGGMGGAWRRTPERTPPTTSCGGPTTRSRSRASSVPAEKCAPRTGPLARPSARGVPRGPPSSGRNTRGAQPVMTSPAGTAVRNLSAALTLQASGGARGGARTPTPQRGTPPPE